MGLYNMVFGESQDAGELLSLLGLNDSDFYRYRDCYLTEDNQIAVYTRGGGGNRECWSDDCKDYIHNDGCVITIQENNQLHPLYLSDKDDAFDCTYATFFFRVPENADRELLAKINPEISRNDLWIEMLDALKKGMSHE